MAAVIVSSVKWWTRGGHISAFNPSAQIFREGWSLGRVADDAGAGALVMVRVIDRSVPDRERRTPAGTSTDMFALMTATSRLRHMCLECSQEYHGFVLRSLSGVNPNLPQAEQLKALSKAATDADSHMRNWTKQRKA